MKASREKAIRALNEPVTNWLDKADVIREPRPATIVVPVRLGADDAEWLAGEGERRRANPSTVLAELVHRAIDQRTATPPDPAAVEIAGSCRTGVRNPAG